MTFEELLLVLMVIALALGYGACAALVVRNYRIADALFITALGVAGSMLLASMGSACALVGSNTGQASYQPHAISFHGGSHA